MVYFPAGTYIISKPIRPQYLTQVVGDPTNLPTIKASSGFAGIALIDGDPYYTSVLNWGSTNVFYRQIRNFKIDSSAVSSSIAQNLIHWPTAQATSLQNIIFNMPTGSKHVGLFIEEGSAGFVSDLTFNGGAIGANVGNQQFTMRNLTFNNCGTAILQIWDWGWTYIGLTINNCGTGIDMSAGGSSAQNVGSVTVIDSTFSGTPTGILTARTGTFSPATGGSLILENVQWTSVGTAVKGGSGTILAGGSYTTSAWGTGNRYIPGSHGSFQGTFTANARPSSLLSGSKYYTASKPQYNSLAASSVVSARSSGAKGDGNTDDTAALQSGINAAASAGKLFWLDYGIYKVTNTITIPPGAKIAGEAYPIIMSSGSKFASQSSPLAVVRIGNAGQSGTVALSDFVVSTQGAQGGAILIEYNLVSPAGSPSGMWDVHTRIGGFQGSNLQVSQCPAVANNNNPPAGCIAAFLSFHATSGSSGLYMENTWFWTADHDIDSSSNTRVNIYTGRGLRKYFNCLILYIIANQSFSSYRLYCWHFLARWHGRRASHSVPIPVCEHQEHFRRLHPD